MQALQAPLRKYKDARLVSFSVDPERDTPPVLSEYAERYLADEDRWLFLTGEKPRVYAVIREGFQLGVGGVEEGTDQIMHSLRFALVDKKGRVRAYYDGTDPGPPEETAAGPEASANGERLSCPHSRVRFSVQSADVLRPRGRFAAGLRGCPDRLMELRCGQRVRTGVPFPS